MATNKIRLTIVTPTRILYDQDVSMAIIRGTEGDLGILYGHQPLTISLDYGLLKIINGDEEIVATALGGFAEITPKKITVLSDTAEWPDEIDTKRAEESKARAERRLQQQESDIDLVRAEMALKRALIRLDAKNYNNH